MSTYCPRCRCVRNVQVQRTPVIEGDKRFVWETIHCLVCGTFIRSTKQEQTTTEEETS